MQVTTISGVFIDGDGRRAEVIQRDLCDGRGTQPWIRVSWNGFLLGDGYYRTPEQALALLDTTTIVELLTHPVSAPGGSGNRATPAAPPA